MQASPQHSSKPHLPILPHKCTPLACLSSSLHPSIQHITLWGFQFATAQFTSIVPQPWTACWALLESPGSPSHNHLDQNFLPAISELFLTAAPPHALPPPANFRRSAAASTLTEPVVTFPNSIGTPLCSVEEMARVVPSVAPRVAFASLGRAVGCDMVVVVARCTLHCHGGCGCECGRRE